jgi:hypothetical protein
MADAVTNSFETGITIITTDRAAYAIVTTGVAVLGLFTCAIIIATTITISNLIASGVCTAGISCGNTFLSILVTGFSAVTEKTVIFTWWCAVLAGT